MAERLRHDPMMRWIVGGRAAQGGAASPSQMGRFETPKGLLLTRLGQKAYGSRCMVSIARTNVKLFAKFLGITFRVPYRGDSNKLVADPDRRKRGQAFQPGHGMVNRFMTAQSTAAAQRWEGPAVVTLAAMAALAALARH